MNGTVRKLVVPGVLAAGLGAGITLAEVVRDPIPSATAQEAAAAPPVVQPPASAQGLATAFRQAAGAARNGVVYIQTVSAARTVSQQVPPELRGTPFEEMFGGGRSMRVPPSQASGSGFIVSPEGYVITNNHVVEGATKVKVVMNDNREFEARVVGRDPNTDIAVLKIDARNLPTVRLGDSDALDTGDWVLALGYPLQLGQTTTAGIVSAKGRSIGIMARSESATAPLEHYIQTDAAINPGNSGGPLVDLQGRVVGVNSAIASPTGYYSGYGFAVPINLARRVADDLIRYGVVHRPRMGVEIRDVTTADAQVFGLPSASGAVIASEPQGAARAAGLAMGDVITALDGQPVKSEGDLMETIMRKEPGDAVRVDYVRYGARRSATLRLEQFQDGAVAKSAGDAGAAADDDESGGRLGFSVQQMTPEIAQAIQSRRADGVVVNDIDPSGPAAGQLFRGLVVEQVNGRRIDSVPQLREAVNSLREGQVVSLITRRPDGTHAIINLRAR